MSHRLVWSCPAVPNWGAHVHRHWGKSKKRLSPGYRVSLRTGAGQILTNIMTPFQQNAEKMLGRRQASSQHVWPRTPSTDDSARLGLVSGSLGQDLSTHSPGYRAFCVPSKAPVSPRSRVWMGFCLFLGKPQFHLGGKHKNSVTDSKIWFNTIR